MMDWHPAHSLAGARRWHAELVRVLIIGAGVAGLTLAARLAQQGRPPVVIERSADPGAGYAIGLYPMGSCVLHGLGRYHELLARGLVVNDYEIADHAGRVLKRVDMSVLTGAVDHHQRAD